MAEDPDILNSTAEPDYGVSFPISLYDRPLLAMSNLLLRGNVDAATRAIFTPETLTPAEMQSFTRRFAGPKPNPLVKTILDVATNPLVIAGLVGGFLIWPAANPAALSELFLSMRKAVPATGLSGQWVGAAFTRLRHLVGPKGSMHEAIADLSRATANFVYRNRNLRADAYGHLGSAVGKGGAGGQRMSAWMQGWAQGAGELEHLYGIKGPISPGLQALMQTPEIGAAAKTRNWSRGLIEKLLGSDAAARKELEALAKARGVSLGKIIDEYIPHMTTPNEFRRTVLRNDRMKETVVDWRKPLSGNLLRRPGRNIPDPKTLLAMEARGEVRKGFTQELLAKVDADVAQFRGQLAKELAGVKDSKDIKKVLGKLIEQSDMSEHYVDSASQRLYAAVTGAGGESVDQAIDWAAKMIRTPGTYSLDFDPIWTRYVGKMAPTWAFHVERTADGAMTLGRKVETLMKEFAATGQLAKGGADFYLNKQLLPMMTGTRTARQMARAQKWAEWRLRRAELLKTPVAKKLIPADTRQWMIRNLEDLHSLDIETVGHGINEYLYLSTMGANIGPPTKNVWQNPLTFVTLPGMGLGAWVKGIGETFQRGMAYLADAGKLGPRQAFERHFSDFIETMGPRETLLNRLFGTQLHVGMPATGARSVMQKVKDVMMAPFQFSELWVNRMPAFYGARARGLQWNLSREAANRMAGNVVDVAHFTGGPMGMPAGIMDWWAPWRQFMQFPLRLVDFTMASTRMGKTAGQLDFGTISRMVAASAAAYTVGKGLLGADVSQGLLAGALPLPQYEQAAFYPAPLVPPIVQMAGNVVKGVATGDARPIQDTAALLVPGGLAAKRLVKTLGPKRADYDNRLADGRVPVYNEQGGLIGAYSPLQLGLRALGVMPAEASAERGAAQWLVKQRDQIRQYRQAWLDAQLANDPVKADRVQAEFQKRYPELGPMQFRKSDLNSIQQRRETARINRIIRGFPKDYKPLFENIMTEAQLGAFTQNAPATPLPPGLATLQ